MESRLSRSTLVLNAAYQPIEKVHWVKAFIKVYQGRARTVEYYDEIVRSSSDEYFIPAVIVCTEFSRLPRRKTSYAKRKVLQRDSFLCQYCRRQLTQSSATIDHVLPRSRGGKSTFLNCVCSCEPCNSFKADKTPAEARMKLIRQPRKPFIHPLKGKIGIPEPEWENYLTGVI
jgi:5-methylcytosine-specific restriction endonuclease McrA